MISDNGKEVVGVVMLHGDVVHSLVGYYLSMKKKNVRHPKKTRTISSKMIF